MKRILMAAAKLVVMSGLVLGAPVQADKAGKAQATYQNTLDAYTANLKLWTGEYNQAHDQAMAGDLDAACVTEQLAIKRQALLDAQGKIIRKAVWDMNQDAESHPVVQEITDIYLGNHSKLDNFTNTYCQSGDRKAKFAEVVSGWQRYFDLRYQDVQSHLGLANDRYQQGDTIAACFEIGQADNNVAMARRELNRIVPVNPQAKLYGEADLRARQAQMDAWEKSVPALHTSYCQTRDQAVAARDAQIAEANRIAEQSRAAAAQANGGGSGLGVRSDPLQDALRAECAGIRQANEQHRNDSNWSPYNPPKCMFVN